MGGSVSTVFKNVFEQANLIRNRTKFVSEKQRQTNGLIRLYFLSTLGLFITQIGVTQQENLIYTKYIQYRQKLNMEREFVKSTI